MRPYLCDNAEFNCLNRIVYPFKLYKLQYIDYSIFLYFKILFSDTIQLPTTRIWGILYLSPYSDIIFSILTYIDYICFIYANT